MASRSAVVISSLLVPGSGQILLGRLLRGVVLAFLWLILAACSLTALFIWPKILPATAQVAIVAVTIATYLFSQAEMLFLLRGLPNEKSQEEANLLYKQASIDYLKGQFPEANKKLQQLVRLSSDDADAYMLMAQLARTEGKIDQARRWLKRAHFLDEKGKWDTDIQRQLTEPSPAPHPHHTDNATHRTSSR